MRQLKYVFFSWAFATAVKGQEIKSFQCAISYLIKIDEKKKIVLREDSVGFTVILICDRFVSELDRINLSIGESKNSASIYDGVFTITSRNKQCFIGDGRNPETPIPEGPKQMFNVRIPKSTSMKYATVSFTDRHGKSSEKKYFELERKK